jgi:UDP-glucose 6-dehydrogenase
MADTADRSAIGVVGVGYVGLVTAVCFADLGHDVICVDVSPERIEALREGRAPIYEQGIERLLELHRGRLTFTLDLADVFERANIVFVCVDTPPTHSGDADLSRVHRVIDDLPQLEQRVVLVMKSTVPVGTGERLRADLDARGLHDVGYVSNPEFLREGRAIVDFTEPDRIVIGSFERADGDIVQALYHDLDAPVVRTDPASAEMIKYASNAFLATKISFINEIANVCEEVGADVGVVAHAMGLDERIGGHFLRPGIGYGGSCLPGDEYVTVRHEDEAEEVSLEDLFERDLDDIEVLAWQIGSDVPDFLPASVATSRPYDGELVEVEVESGARVRTTTDHPFVVLVGDTPQTVLAEDLEVGMPLPVVVAPPVPTVDPLMGVLQPLTPPGPLEMRVAWSRIRNLRRHNYVDEVVYSLEVPEAQTFVTGNGIVVHNCFPKDVQALKQLAGNSGYHFQLLTAVIEVNELQKRRVVSKLERHLGSLRGRRIALLGLAFKSNTDDMREASSLVLASRLLAEGAEVVAYDPVAMENARRLLGDRVELAPSMLEAVTGADGLVIVTEWGEFRSAASPAVRDAMATPFIVDGRNLLDPAQARAAGFAYESVGRAGAAEGPG